MNFIKSAKTPETKSEKAYYFIFSGNDILVTGGLADGQDEVFIPCMCEKEAKDMGIEGLRFIGKYHDTDCYSAHLVSSPAVSDDYRLIGLRALYTKVDSDFWGISGYARQIHDWNLNFQFCGRCGEKTRAEDLEHARVCDRCRLSSYPRISPATITAVIKDEKILLARGVNFPNKQMFSVLAGFVSPGETLEECVKREIFEESGIRVKNIRYFKSQSWPFPDSLMIGFTAEYAGGSISIDTTEIIEAGWFSKDDLPLVPGKMSLAGELIEWFVSGQNG